MIAGPLVAVATGQFPMQDHVPQPVRPIAPRVRRSEEGNRGGAERGCEMQRPGITPDKYPAARDEGGQL
jgi:hypothetical protein